MSCARRRRSPLPRLRCSTAKAPADAEGQTGGSSPMPRGWRESRFRDRASRGSMGAMVWTWRHGELSAKRDKTRATTQCRQAFTASGIRPIVRDAHPLAIHRRTAFPRTEKHASGGDGPDLRGEKAVSDAIKSPPAAQTGSPSPGPPPAVNESRVLRAGVLTVIFRERPMIHTPIASSAAAERGPDV